VDLDGDGRIDLPRERIRLLYVDTPELHESHKGQDVAHGLPAKRFVQDTVNAQQQMVTLAFGPELHDRYGRTLALVWAGSVNLNQELIRQGHSYFDNRFGFPPDMDAWREAEAQAFAHHAGIWADSLSRRNYLARLRQEGKTPADASNIWYGGGVFPTEKFRAETKVGKFVRLRGRVNEVRQTGRVRVFTLDAPPGHALLRAVLLPKTAELLQSPDWKAGDVLELEGFLQVYRGEVELKLHYGRLAPLAGEGLRPSPTPPTQQGAKLPAP